MNKLELAWETFEFHLASSADNESKLHENINVFMDSLAGEPSDPIEESERKIRIKNVNNLNKLISCSNELINDYKKQNASLKDLTSLYKSYAEKGTPIPDGREVSIMTLNELRNTNATMIEQLNIQRDEFKSLLG
tara:strand:- start:731 stop:1135 length:405 start_codon:yes stop_codon:yes gene_type:complete